RLYTPQQVTQRAALVVTERGQRLGGEVQVRPDLPAHLRTDRGRGDQLDPAIGRARLPRHKAPRRQPVDQAGDVGRLTFEHRRDLVHRHRVVRDHAQQFGLHAGEVVSRGRGLVFVVEPGRHVGDQVYDLTGYRITPHESMVPGRLSR